MNYTAEEILAIIQDLYAISCSVAPGVLDNSSIRAESTIQEVIDIFDFEFARDFAKDLLDFLPFVENKQIVCRTLSTSDALSTQLADWCSLLAQHSAKPEVKERTLLGHKCREAALFRYMQTELTKRGCTITALRPRSPLATLDPELLMAAIEASIILAPGYLKTLPCPESGKGILLLGLLFFVLPLALLAIQAAGLVALPIHPLLLLLLIIVGYFASMILINKQYNTGVLLKNFHAIGIISVRDMIMAMKPYTPHAE